MCRNYVQLEKLGEGTYATVYKVSLVVLIQESLEFAPQCLCMIQYRPVVGPQNLDEEQGTRRTILLPARIY